MERRIQTLSQNEIVLEANDLDVSLNKKNIIHILHVDDDYSTLEISKQILLEMGDFEIDNANCADEALEKLSTTQYDVVISDYEMPQKSGLDFLKILREKNNQIPFILFTGKGREEVAIQALNLGADGYFNKQGSPETVYGELSHNVKAIVEHSRAKKLLLESENKYRTLIEQSTQGLLLGQGPIPHIVFANSTMARIMGYSVQELSSLSLQQVKGLVHPDDRELFFERFQKRLQGETKPARHEFRGIKKNGSTVWLELSSALIEYQGQPTLQATFADITDRKKAEKELGQERNMLESVTAASGAGLAIISKDYHVLWANDFIKRYKGDTIGKLCYATLNSLDAPCSDCGVAKIFAGKTTLDSHEYCSTTVDGNPYWVEIVATPLMDENGNIASAVEIAVDVTERKKIEEKNRLLATIVASSEDAIISKNLEGIITSWNYGAQKIYGYNAVEVIGKSIQILATSENKDEIKLIMERISNGETIKHYETKRLRKDGEKIDISLSISPIRNETGTIIGASTIARDITKCKIDESKLREIQYLNQKMLDCSPNLIYIYDLEKNSNFYANREVFDFLGYTPLEIKAMGSELFARVLHPDDAQIVAKHHARFVNAPDNATYTVEYRMKHANGEWRWLRSRDTLFARTKDGFGKQILGTCEDITEAKKVMMVLQENEQRYRELANCLSGIVFETDQKGQLEFANEKAEEKSGYSLSEIKKGLNILQFLVPEDREKATKNLQRLLVGGSYTPSEYTLLRKDGSTFPAIITATPRIHNGKITGFRGLVLDISERKQAEEKLKESEERSKAIIANSPIGIATSGVDKQFLSANEAFCKLLGYTEKELRKLTFKDITHPADFKESALKMEELEKGKASSFTLEKRYIKKDGGIVDGKVMVSEVSNQNGKPALFVTELEDITERKKIEERRKVLERKVNDYSKYLKYMVDLRTTQLKDANERLVKAERLAAIGELAGMVGHDLRNPLAGIKNAVYFLKKKGTTIKEEQSKEMLEVIDKAIEHSDKIINDLLEYAKDMHLELTDTTLPMLLDAALRMIQVPDRIQILNHVNEKILIRVDADKIMRIFMNLIKNAIDATPEKGKIEISSCKIRDCIEIAFVDTGIGISKETLPKIFTPLFTTKAQGMGFGLAICKRIIEAHGGTIKVKTTINKGTTFTISLPTKPKAPQTENQTVRVK